MKEKRITDKTEALKTVKQNSYSIQYLSDELRNDREIVLMAVKQNGYLIQYLSDELKNDREIVLEAVKQDGRLIKYLSDEIYEAAEDGNEYESIKKYFEMKDLQDKLKTELVNKEVKQTKIFKI